MRYQVNVVIARNGHDGAPVVIEQHPTYQNLIGRMEHQSQFGTLTTDFTLIKPGALHRAAGGYLVLDAHKVLTQWGAWEGLKRALSTRCLRLESLAEMYSMVSTVTLEPQSIPLDIKVVLIGDRNLYYALYQFDPDFARLFKVCADFEDDFDRSETNAHLFARMIATALRREKLLPFDRGAVARIIEHSARETGDSRKLSGNMSLVVDLLGEADYWARGSQRTEVTQADVQQAIDAQLHRADRLRERVHEQIHRGTVMIDTSGERVGQINALSVYELGNFAFAEPTRITATTRLGDGDVIDVQREVDLGGSIHSKGVMILAAFLAARYSGTRPHSLSASLVFEQTYGEIDGDSASLAELCALLSSLANVPIRQSFAVTGSVNQLGQVQAIGAVNEKIEGFFDICRGRDLTGAQGVLIPASNVEHLMLRNDVVEAAASGTFRIYAVSTVDEAVTLLTGMPAGDAGDGRGRHRQHHQRPRGAAAATIHHAAPAFRRRRPGAAHAAREGPAWLNRPRSYRRASSSPAIPRRWAARRWMRRWRWRAASTRRSPLFTSKTSICCACRDCRLPASTRWRAPRRAACRRRNSNAPCAHRPTRCARRCRVPPRP